MTGPATDAAATVPPPAVAEATVAVAHPLPDSVAIAGMSMHFCTVSPQHQTCHSSFLDPTDRHMVNPVRVSRF